MYKKRTFLLIIFSNLFGQISLAKNYYFSSSVGNDAFTSLQAQNPITPWRTTAKLNSFFPNISPGDSILFKKGDVFGGSIVVNKSGTSALPITISSYGNGPLPKLTLPPIVGWLQNSDGVYSIKRQMWPFISIFYEDGKPLIPMATSLNCTDGNWWCDNSNVYYRPASGTIGEHVITVANIVVAGGYQPAIDLSNSSYINIDGLELDAFGIGIKTFDTIQGTVGLIIQNSIFSYCQRAIFMMPDADNNTNTTIKNCFFYRNQCAISMYTTSALGGRPGQTHGTNISCKIIGNEMSENGTIDGTIHWIYGTDFEAIGLQNFMNGSITHNYVHDGFQIGIIFYNLDTRSSDNNIISQNRIFNNGKGGFVMQGDYCDEGLSANYSFNNNFIANNVFINSAFTASQAEGTIYIFQGKNSSKMNYFVNNTLSGNLNVITFPTSRPPFFTIENNIIYNSGKFRFVSWYWSAKPTSLVMDYNIYFETNGISNGFVLKTGLSLSAMQTLGLEGHSKVINPLFMNIPVNDYRLQIRSPAIDAGIDVGLLYYGNAPDIGAFEYNNLRVDL